jgi:hypothetical protein
MKIQFQKALIIDEGEGEYHLKPLEKEFLEFQNSKIEEIKFFDQYFEIEFIGKAYLKGENFIQEKAPSFRFFYKGENDSGEWILAKDIYIDMGFNIDKNYPDYFDNSPIFLNFEFSKEENIYPYFIISPIPNGLILYRNIEYGELGYMEIEIKFQKIEGKERLFQLNQLKVLGRMLYLMFKTDLKKVIKFLDFGVKQT